MMQNTTIDVPSLKRLSASTSVVRRSDTPRCRNSATTAIGSVAATRAAKTTLVRQSTGCDNALGVIKFNLTSPFDVYMHDTNLKSAFQSSYRYYSHGCIRLEKPIELGNFLLHGRLDPLFLQSCLKDQKPVTVKPDKPVPVFVVYGMAGFDAMNNVIYYKDIYRLMK